MRPELTGIGTVPHSAAEDASGAQPVGVVAGGDQQLGADHRADAP